MKSLKPLTPVYGFYSGQQDSLYRSMHNICRLDVGWLDLNVGFDENQREFLLATTSWNAFQITANPPDDWCRPAHFDSPPWVYSLTDSPEEYLASATPPVALQFSGFRVVYGVDSNRRQYLYVVYPGTKWIILFRNPKSRSVLPCTPPGAKEILNRQDQWSKKKEALPASA